MAVKKLKTDKRYSHQKDRHPYVAAWKKDKRGIFVAVYTACCDCGLVHTLEYEPTHKGLRITPIRNKKETKKHRKARGIKL